jgi:hypothetical protein
MKSGEREPIRMKQRNEWSKSEEERNEERDTDGSESGDE